MPKPAWEAALQARNPALLLSLIVSFGCSFATAALAMQLGSLSFPLAAFNLAALQLQLSRCSLAAWFGSFQLSAFRMQLRNGVLAFSLAALSLHCAALEA